MSRLRPPSSHVLLSKLPEMKEERMLHTLRAMLADYGDVQVSCKSGKLRDAHALISCALASSASHNCHTGQAVPRLYQLNTWRRARSLCPPNTICYQPPSPRLSSEFARYPLAVPSELRDA
eukprot:45602-Pleurochrysis_carterae.AAC.2